MLTADYSFLSYYPYYGFQGLTSHYANPLAQFDKRAAAIESWATLTTADQFIAALDKLPWKPPTVFLMRRGANDTYTLRLASDVYPNQPNVRRYHVALDKALFDDPRFDVSDHRAVRLGDPEAERLMASRPGRCACHGSSANYHQAP